VGARELQAGQAVLRFDHYCPVKVFLTPISAL
jgi:hypothetical protein